MYFYLIGCMLITFIALEIYLYMGGNSSDQRLLPLILGLTAVYDFYVLIEYITNATNVFAVLKYLLLVEVMFLIFYYVHDFTQVKMKWWVTFLAYAFILTINVIICLDLYYERGGARLILSIISVLVVATFLFSTLTLLVLGSKIQVNSLYTYLYIAYLFPVLGLTAILVFHVRDVYVMPGMLSIMCIITSILLLTHKFEDTSKYIRENFFNQMDGATFIFDPDMRFVSATKKAEEMFSEQMKEVRTLNRRGEIRKDLLDWSHENDENPAPRNVTLNDIHLKAVMDVVKNRGRIQGYIIYVIDVTEEIDDAELAKELALAKGEYLANMSHELRSPLHAIIGGIELMASSRRMSGANLEIAKRIRVSGYNLLEIVNGILDYSKVENSMMELTPVKYDLWQTLHMVYQNMLATIENPEIDFSIWIKDELPKSLLGDENRVASMIVNVVSNAIKYTKEGSIKCTVTCETLENNKVKISFTVTDTGIGISEEKQATLFEKYKSFAIKGVESTGIGLYLVKYLSNMMGGDVSVVSKEGEGSTFTVWFIQGIDSKDIYLPVTINRSTLYFKRDSIEKPVSTNFIYPEAKVLVVDDMKVNREIIKGKLSPWKFKIMEASDGKTAVNMAKENAPDIIFMDHMMPEMSGIEAACEIKKFSSVPIVIVTANISDAMQKEVEKNGLSGFLAKPINTGHLMNIVEELLPEELREIPVIDASSISSFAPGDMAYRYTLEAYIEEIEELLENLETMYHEDIETFGVKVHGIKGISRQLNRPQIAMYSEVFEMAVKSDHRTFIETYLASYLDELRYAAEDARQELENLSSY